MISVKCNLCGRDDWSVRFPGTIDNASQPDVDAMRCTCDGYGSHLQIVECRHCGHVYANPCWEANDILGAYEGVEDETYVAERAGRERTFAHHLKALEKFVGPDSNRDLLDVGAYIGVFVEIARAGGWQAVGVEPSCWAATYAQNDGIPIIQGTLDADELQGCRFDVITLWDVIEHLNDPSAALDKLYRLLKPGGLVVVHTMNIDSLTAKIMGPRWPWLMDMHIHYFSRRTLVKFLKKSGFEVIWTGAQGRYLSLGYLVTRVNGLSRPFGRLLGEGVTHAGLEAVTVPVNFGDLMTIYARRPQTSRPEDAPATG